MSWREKIERNVQARAGSAVYANSTSVFLSKGHLSPSLSELEPEHHSYRLTVYEPVISKNDLMKITMTMQRYRRRKN